MTYSMQFDTTQEIASNLGQVATELTDVGESLMNMINQHMAEMDGDTKNQFLLIQQRYNQCHEQMVADLSKSQADLMQIHDLIQHGEKVGTQTWQM